MHGCATRQELARQVAYLKEENRLLRARLPKRIVTTPAERRRLLKVGRKLGTQLMELITIVSYGSFRRWIRDAEASRKESAAEKPKRKGGRPKTTAEIVRRLEVAVVDKALEVESVAVCDRVPGRLAKSMSMIRAADPAEV